MVVFPNCKVNLGLRIVDKRSDGYHNIETVFYPLPWYDALEVLPLTENVRQSIHLSKQTKYQIDNILFVQSGLDIKGNPADNLCVKAFQLLKEKFPSLLPVFIHLHKVLPTEAGLGGGSADAAIALKTIVQLFDLNINTNQLENVALQLGSDCPFFLYNQPCIASAQGEKLQPIQINLNNYNWILINPGIAVSTAWAFSQIKPQQRKEKLENIIYQPIENWNGRLINDFEEPVFAKFPDIKKIKQLLYDEGALYASLSGSGSTVYGIFPLGTKPNFNLPSTYIVKTIMNKNK